MKALVHDGYGNIALLDRPLPRLTEPTDAIVRVTREDGCLKVAIRPGSGEVGAVRSAVHREAPAQTIGVSALCGKVD